MKEVDCTVDVTRLIAEMHKRPALWNQKHVLYHNREVTNRMWIELSAILNVQKPYLKTKWKGLRDRFRYEMKKDILYRKTADPKNKPTWRHYKDLQFLKEQMLPKPPISDRSGRWEFVDPLTLSVRSSTVQTSGKKTKRTKIRGAASASGTADGDSEDVNFIDVKEEPEFVPDEVEENGEEDEDEDFDKGFTSCEDSNRTSEKQNGEGMGSTNDVSNENTSGESWVDPVETSGQLDDNYHFLMSLLPHIQKLSGERQMLLRMQIQEMVYKEVYKK
ncbi:uncharacterized protein LOC107035416 isoform X2 [Diachasma alloeum]|uniref:uncharacterized protein LOC107035416 isoform X2 n=1 Tax=Diachasma alloeum TaxID=454923 RepID=UPI0007382E45|nr:uncharacterized protein LOC107035416 isoform X2 [Diachasma alloeum]